MKRSKVLSILVFFAFLLSSCSTKLSSLDGTLTFKARTLDECRNYEGSKGELSTGSGEVLGPIEISQLLKGVGSMGLVECEFSIEASEINLGTNVLIVEFAVDDIFSGRWILQPSDFNDGQISLSGGTPWSD